MQTKILNKLLEELNKESPNIDYMRGMLETLVEVEQVSKDAYLVADGTGKVRITTPEKEIQNALAPKDPEAAVLEAGVSAALAKMQPLEQ